MRRFREPPRYSATSNNAYLRPLEMLLENLHYQLMIEFWSRIPKEAPSQLTSSCISIFTWFGSYSSFKPISYRLLCSTSWLLSLWPHTKGSPTAIFKLSLAISTKLILTTRLLCSPQSLPNLKSIDASYSHQPRMKRGMAIVNILNNLITWSALLIDSIRRSSPLTRESKINSSRSLNSKTVSKKLSWREISSCRSNRMM